MRPRSFYLLGALITLAGFIAVSIGVGLYYQLYTCTTSPSACTLNTSDIANLTFTMIILYVFGGSLILVGAIWTAAGHITQNMPYTNPLRDSTTPTVPPPRICARCGKIAMPTAKFCSNCGTPWLSPTNP